TASSRNVPKPAPAVLRTPIDPPPACQRQNCHFGNRKSNPADRIVHEIKTGRGRHKQNNKPSYCSRGSIPRWVGFAVELPEFRRFVSAFGRRRLSSTGRPIADTRGRRNAFRLALELRQLASKLPGRAIAVLGIFLQALEDDSVERWGVSRILQTQRIRSAVH